jgi:hypothetical protein
MALAVMIAFGSGGASDDKSKGNNKGFYYFNLTNVTSQIIC